MLRRHLFYLSTVAVMATLVALSIVSHAGSSTTPATYQDRTAFQWYKSSVRFRVERDRARTNAGKAIREGRRLHRIIARIGGHGYTVSYAIKLASVAFGVSERDLNVVASCESGHDPVAANGRYRGVFQEGPMFERGPFGQAGFSVWDPFPNVFMAAYTVSRQGWHQWECKP